MKAVRIRVPATTANLGPAFDAVGMALDVYNEVTISRSDELTISVSGEGAGSLPLDPSNLVYRAVQEAARLRCVPLPPLSIECINRIPLSRGLGSSASAIVAGIVCANHLLELGLDSAEMLNLATQIEGHPDNVAPALLGGVVSACTDDKSRVHCVCMPSPEGLTAVLSIPDYHLSTSKARAVLPESLSREDAVFNISRAVLLVASLQCSRYDLLATAMDDRIHQPYRAQLVPGLDEVLRAAVQAGAVGAALSGAGPAVIALCRDDVGIDCKRIGTAMAQAFGQHGISCSIVVARPTGVGALESVEHLPTRV